MDCVRYMSIGRKKGTNESRTADIDKYLRRYVYTTAVQIVQPLKSFHAIEISYQGAF